MRIDGVSEYSAKGLNFARRVEKSTVQETHQPKLDPRNVDSIQQNASLHVLDKLQMEPWIQPHGRRSGLTSIVEAGPGADIVNCKQIHDDRYRN